jgi:hypothetical protein
MFCRRIDLTARRTKVKTNFIAPEARQIVAHSLRCGKNGESFTSPGRGGRTGVFSSCRVFLSPLPGLVVFFCLNPRLSPWAIIFRRCAAGVSDFEKIFHFFNVPALKSGIQRVVYTNIDSASWRSLRLGG